MMAMILSPTNVEMNLNLNAFYQSRKVTLTHTRSYCRCLTGSVVKATTCAYFHLWIFRSIFSEPFPPTYYDYLFINVSSSIPHTRSPFAPRLPWLATCGRWNFLRDMGGVRWIHTESSLFVYVFICIRDVKSTLIQLSTQKSYSHNRKVNNCRFSPEIIAFFFGDHTIHHLTGTALLLDC